MDTREVKAWEMTGDARISFAAGSWHVQSQTSSLRYKVNPSAVAPSCSCEDFQLRGQDRPASELGHPAAEVQRLSSLFPPRTDGDGRAGSGRL
jgi:hypothetical protein